MRLLTKTTFGLLALCVVSLTGCQKVKYEKSFSISPGNVQAYTVDAPRSEQKVTISVTAKDSPVNVYVVLESDQTAVMDALTNDKKIDPSKLLASKEKMDSGTIEVTVPAKKGFSVLVSGGRKNTEVTLKIAGK